MKFMTIIPVILFSLKISASCIEILKLESLRRTSSLSHSLFSKALIKSKKAKSKKFTKKLDELTREKVHIEIASKEIPSQLQEVLMILSREFLKKKNYKIWAKEFYNDLLVSLYLSKNSEYIDTFESSGKIHKDLIISLILERSIEGGFSGKEEDISILESSLEDHEFYAHIKEGKYILDLAFKSENHGDLIHLFHIDLLIFILKKNNINSKAASKLYQYFGRGKKLLSIDGMNYTPWSIFFDGFYGHITTPEYLNKLLIKYFGIKKKEVPSIFYERNEQNSLIK